MGITEDFPFTSVADSNNISYTYNTNGTRLTSAGGKSMTYDNEGQTTAKGAETYTFNVRHQLETVTGSGCNYQYTYDESGRRVKAVRNGVITKYIYGNGSRILAEADSNGVIKRYYIYGHGLIGFYVPGAGYFNCHYDMSGNMVAITDDTGAVAAKFSYTPFGEVIYSTIPQPECDIPLGFAGQFGVLRHAALGDVNDLKNIMNYYDVSNLKQERLLYYHDISVDSTGTAIPIGEYDNQWNKIHGALK